MQLLLAEGPFGAVEARFHAELGMSALHIDGWLILQGTGKRGEVRCHDRELQRRTDKSRLKQKTVALASPGSF